MKVERYFNRIETISIRFPIIFSSIADFHFVVNVNRYVRQPLKNVSRIHSPVISRNIAKVYFFFSTIIFALKKF
uniref:Uncharacterized protein n=1 Tax=Ascaris lumbricoides TaxID=6252 RepID=A0A0M3HM90_ASCLU